MSKGFRFVLSSRSWQRIQISPLSLFRKGIRVKVWQEEQEGVKATEGILSVAGREDMLSSSGGSTIVRRDHFCHCSGRRFRRSAWN